MELHTFALDLMMAQLYIRGSTLRFILTSFLHLCWSLSCEVLQPKYQVTCHNGYSIVGAVVCDVPVATYIDKLVRTKCSLVLILHTYFKICKNILLNHNLTIICHKHLQDNVNLSVAVSDLVSDYHKNILKLEPVKLKYLQIIISYSSLPHYVLCVIDQGCTNVGQEVTIVTNFCTVMPNICGPSLWNLHHITFLLPRILGWLLDFWKICAPLLYTWNKNVSSILKMYIVNIYRSWVIANAWFLLSY